jgi:Flp pilus assembly protein TadD
MPEKSKQKTVQRILVIMFALAFVGSTGAFVVEMFNSGDRSARQTTSKPSNASPTQKSQAEASGYEKVLAREPNNPIALQGLAKARLEMQDFQGAIAPLEKLVKLYPQQQELQAILTVVKQQASQSSPQKSK